MVEIGELHNIRLVRELCAVGENPDYTAETLLPFLAEDCRVRLVHTLPFAHGHAEVVAQAHLVTPGDAARMQIRHLTTQCTGPMVTAHRISTRLIDGKPESSWEILGVFLIEGGKVKEWTDYLLTPFSQREDGTFRD